MGTPPPIDPSALPARIESLPGIARLRQAASGVDAYLVGGVVRDLLLGHRRADLDVVVEGNVAEVAARLGGETVEHERFSTATVSVDGLEVDLATSRAESYAAPGALPEVRPAPLAEDLARRDFTINAMAAPLAGGELIDPHGGLEDLGDLRLRVLHSQSFRDDPTRALRAARYAARLKASLESETERLLRDADLKTVSRDRARAELQRMAAEPTAAEAFGLAVEWGLLEVPPSSLALVGSLRQLLAEPPWSAVTSPEEAIPALAEGATPARDLVDATPERPSQGVVTARGRDPIELALARAAGAEWLDQYVRDWRGVRLEIDGRDLIAAGVPEGPAIGRGLEAALLAKLDGEASDREQELDVAVKAARE